MRQSPDWAALAEGSVYDYTGFDKLAGSPPGSTEALVAWWDASFPISFHRTRLRMKEIAGENIARVRDASVVDIDDFDPPFDDKALYVFTDDDDWFSPDLVARLLGSPAARADGSVWISSIFQGGEVAAREHKLLCYTNNYAIHGAFMNKYETFLYQRPVVRVAQHVGANRVLNKPESKPFLLPEPLSITNKHPATYSRMAQARDNGISLACLLDSYRQPTVISNLEWSQREVEQTREFFLSLLEATRAPPSLV
jgi:hypothetical protein